MSNGDGDSPWAFADHTSLGVGGPAGVVVQASGPTDIAEALTALTRRSTEHLLVFGGGTNVLVSDDGFPGTVLLIEGGEIQAAASPVRDSVDFLVDAGVGWDRFVAVTISGGCGGLELTSGIPGTVGAAPIQNIAAYGQQVCDSITAVGVIDRTTLVADELSSDGCRFGYRTSLFKQEWRDRFVVTHVRFRLGVADATTTAPSTYGDIVKDFERTGEDPTDVAARRRAVLTVRSAKSMLLNTADPMARSAGSFFMNPEVSDEVARDVARRFPAAGQNVQYLEGRHEPSGVSSGRRRVPAALLLRASGFHPGDRWGSVRLSDRHVLAVVTEPGARANDVWMVANHVRHRVRSETGVELQFEPVCIGAFPPFDHTEFAKRYRLHAADTEPDWLVHRR